MAVVVIISSMVLPSSAVVVSVSLSLTITIPLTIPVPFPLLIAIVTATVTISVPLSFAVSSILAISVFSFLRGLLAFAAGSGPTVLRSFLLAKTFLLSLDKLGEGATTAFLVFERLIFAQVFKEW